MYAAVVLYGAGDILVHRYRARRSKGLRYLLDRDWWLAWRYSLEFPGERQAEPYMYMQYYL